MSNLRSESDGVIFWRLGDGYRIAAIYTQSMCSDLHFERAKSQLVLLSHPMDLIHLTSGYIREASYICEDLSSKLIASEEKLKDKLRQLNELESGLGDNDTST